MGAGDPDLAGELVIIVEVARTLVSDDSVDTFRAATGEFATAPGDSPANEPYYARLRVPSFSQSFLGSDWQASAALEFDALEFINVEGALDDEVDPAVYEWRGVSAILYGGLKSWTRSQFKPLPGGQQRVVSLDRGDGILAAVITPEENRLDEPAQENLYPGFEHAYDFAGAADVDFGDVYNLGLRDATVFFSFRYTTAGAIVVALDKRGTVSASAGSAGFVIYSDASDLLSIRLDDGSATVLGTLGSASEFDDDVWHRGFVTISRTADEMIGYIDGVEEMAAVDISSITGSLSSTSALTHGALSTGTNKWPGELDEPGVYYTVLTPNEVRNRYLFASTGVEPGLVGAWPYDENTGAAVISNIVRGPMAVQAILTGANTCSMGDNADPGSGSFTLSGWARWPTGEVGVMASRKTSPVAGTAGYLAGVNSGDVVFQVADGATLYTLTIAGSRDDSTAWGWAMVVDRATKELRGYVLDYQRGTLTVGTPVDITGAGTFGGGSVNFKLGSLDDGSSLFAGNQSWVFYTPLAMTETGVKIALSEQPLVLDDAAPTPPPELKTAAADAGAHFWPLDELLGTTANDKLGAANGTWTAITRVDRDGDLTSGGGSGWVNTGTGEKDILGLPIPVALGRPQRFAPVLIDVSRSIYQYSDPAFGATQEVEAVYDGDTLKTVSTHYTVDLTNSTITLLFTPADQLTMSVKGVKLAGEWLYFPGDLISFVWTEMMGLSSVDTASVAAFNEAHPHESSLWLGPCDQKLSCLYRKLLSPDGYAFRNLSDEMALGTRVEPGSKTPVLTLERSDIVIGGVDPVDVPPPTWLARCAYERTISKFSSVSVGAVFGQSLRYVEDQRVEVKERSPEALIRTYETPIHRRSDAGLLVQRMLDLDGPERQAWVVALTVDHWAVDLGEEVLINEYSRYDLTGKQLAVVGYRYSLVDGLPLSALVLWG